MSFLLFCIFHLSLVASLMWYLARNVTYQSSSIYSTNSVISPVLLTKAVIIGIIIEKEEIGHTKNRRLYVAMSDSYVKKHWLSLFLL